MKCRKCFVRSWMNWASWWKDDDSEHTILLASIVPSRILKRVWYLWYNVRSDQIIWFFQFISNDLNSMYSKLLYSNIRILINYIVLFTHPTTFTRIYVIIMPPQRQFFWSIRHASRAPNRLDARGRFSFWRAMRARRARGEEFLSL